MLRKQSSYHVSCSSLGFTACSISWWAGRVTNAICVCRV